MLVEEDRADHIDLNFGCPVPKVTRRGGGSALPWKIDLFTSIVQTAVKEASKGNVPLTIKMRKGIDEDHLTYLDAGRIARDSGVAAVALHGRTAAQFYSGQADWSAIARLREALPDMPVLGNGDIWSAEDAVRMVRETGVDGVVVGRGCQGRPWLFGDLQAAFEGSDSRHKPGPAAGGGGRLPARRTHGGNLRQTNARPCAKSASTWPGTSRATWWAGNSAPSWPWSPRLEVLREYLDELDMDSPYPGVDSEGPRGRAGSPKKPALPKDWLVSRQLNDEQCADISAAELDVSGG